MFNDKSCDYVAFFIPNDITICDASSIISKVITDHYICQFAMKFDITITDDNLKNTVQILVPHIGISLLDIMDRITQAIFQDQIVSFLTNEINERQYGEINEWVKNNFSTPVLLFKWTYTVNTIKYDRWYAVSPEKQDVIHLKLKWFGV